MMFMGGWMMLAGWLLLALVVAVAAALGGLVAVLLARTARR
jgi:hypothetical protein